MKKSNQNRRARRATHLTRALALTASAAMTVALVPAAAAEETVSNGVTPTCDEAYYAMLDYYGNLTDGSVVKSYAMNGVSTLTDYGTYDSVTNLTDGTEPETAGGKTTFDFGSGAPDHFYFEGKTDAPFKALPWTITMSYTLNGVPAKAEDLAGKTGVVEIKADVVPNANASQYAKDNETLEAMAVFNQNDILSLEAPGAQVQLVGNMRMVLFVAMPGETQHFVIRVGSDDFSFTGMTFLIVPATLSQLSDISDLKDEKADLEDSYDKLNASLDRLLDSMDGMDSSLNTAASGLEELNGARGTISAGKGDVYAGLDKTVADLGDLSGLLDPVAKQMETAGKTLSDSKTAVQTLVSDAASLKTELAALRTDLTALQSDNKDIRTLVSDAENLQSTLTNLKTALNDAKVTVATSDTSGGIVDTVTSLHSAYDSGTKIVTSGDNLTQFIAAALLAGGETNTETVAAEAKGLRQLADATQAQATALEKLTQWQQAQALKTLFTNAGGTDSNYDFKVFCKAILLKQGYTADKAEKLATQMGQVWTVCNSSDSADKASLQLLLSSMDDLTNNVNTSVTDANTTLSGLTGPTATLVGKLSDLCGELNGLYNALNDADSLAEVGKTASAKGGAVLDDLTAVQKVLSDYEPTAQESLKTISDLSTKAAGSIRDVSTLITTTEALAKKSGTQLDAGTQKTLDGLAATLRKAASGLSDTDDARSAHDSITNIIDTEWDKHTGDKDNLLNMDANAAAVSLTSDQNPAPESIQVLIRSQEIKVPDEEESESAAKTTDNGTFWSRIGKLFAGIWDSITGIFKH